MSVQNGSSAAGEEQEAQDAGPRMVHGAGSGPPSADQRAEHKAATKGDSGAVGVSEPAASAAGVVKEIKAPDERFWTSDVDELAQEVGGAREEGDPVIYAEAYMQRYSAALAGPAAHTPDGTIVEAAGGTLSQDRQPEEAIGRERESEAAGSSAHACSEQPSSTDRNANTAGSQAESASTSTAQDSRVLEGREAGGVQEVILAPAILIPQMRAACSY